MSAAPSRSSATFLRVSSTSVTSFSQGTSWRCAKKLMATRNQSVSLFLSRKRFVSVTRTCTTNSAKRALCAPKAADSARYPSVPRTGSACIPWEMRPA